MHWLFIVALSFTVWLGSGPIPSHAMDNETKIRFSMEIQRILDRSPRYVWGGSESEEKGLDCSGFLFLAARRAGLLVSRTTAYNMALGRCGWDGLDIELRDADDTDIFFWSWADKPHRPNGHVGIYFGNKNGWPAVVHASQSRDRVVQDEFKGIFLRDLTKIRRLD